MTNLIFRSPHLIVLFCCTTEIMVLTCMRLFCTTPLLLTFDSFNWSGRGTDTVSTLELWVGNCSNGRAEKGVRLQLYSRFLIWTLGSEIGFCCQSFLLLSNFTNLQLEVNFRDVHLLGITGRSQCSVHELRGHRGSVTGVCCWDPPTTCNSSHHHLGFNHLYWKLLE